MVYFEDTGSTLDIALDEMDTFLDSDEHGAVHSDDVRNFEVVENNGATVAVTYERRFEGDWKKAKTRITSFPPYCRCIEELEGVFAGSRFVVIHRPAGSITRVEVFGEVRCAGKDPEELRRLWLDLLAKAQDDDVRALRQYRARA
jgi:hypothetical protein